MAGIVLGIKQLLQKQYTLIDDLDQSFTDCIGIPEDTFTAIIYGGSGNGKSTFTMQFLKALCNANVGDILYGAWEEAHGATIQSQAIRAEMQDCPIRFLDGEDFEDFHARLKKKKSAKIIVIDSWQYTGFTFENYKLLKKDFVFGKTPGKRKIFIFISHSQGKMPDGKTAIKIEYDANIKIRVEGLIAFVKSRYGSKQNYVIDEQKAKAYWQKQYTKMLGKLPPQKKPPPPKPERSTKTTVSVLPPETDEEVEAAILKKLKDSKT